MTKPDLRERVPDAVRLLSNQLPFKDIPVDVYHPVGSLDDQNKNVLRNILNEMKDQDPSHLVTGVYTIENIESRPDNVYVLIGKPSIIINVSSSQAIIIGTNASDSELHFVTDLIDSFHKFLSSPLVMT